MPGGKGDSQNLPVYIQSSTPHRSPYWLHYFNLGAGVFTSKFPLFLHFRNGYSIKYFSWPLFMISNARILFFYLIGVIIRCLTNRLTMRVYTPAAPGKPCNHAGFKCPIYTPHCFCSWYSDNAYKIHFGYKYLYICPYF